jgi:uncharacterized membrane protein (DUF2068 family)
MASNRLGFRLIGAYKVATGLLLLAAGFGMFRLMNKDVGEVLERFLVRLRLDPDNRVAQFVIARLGQLDNKHLKAIAAGTFASALLRLVEGVGLFLRQRWAAYLTVIATSSLVPLELYELARKVTAVRVTVLIVNLAIVVYLAAKLRQERHAGP